MRDERIRNDNHLKTLQSRIDESVKEIESLHIQSKHYDQLVETIEKNFETFEISKLKQLNRLEIFMHFKADQLTEYLYLRLENP